MLIQSPESIKDNFRGFSKEELNTTNEKMEHVKRLLSTAAAGTGIVGDLDATTQQATPATHYVSRKPERNLWRLEEVKEMLSIMQETNALDLLSDKMVKSETVFHDVEKMMIRRGYNKKSHNQIWTKWKFLKSTYMTSRRNGIIPKMIPSEIYFILHKMLGNGSDLMCSMEESSNAASYDGDQSGWMKMDHEDGSSPHSNTNGQGKSNADDSDNVAKSDAFGMAHPIFGFRLGMVKSEPADTGYDTTANNSVISENDSLENAAIYPVELSPQDSQDNSVKPDTDERVTDSPERPKSIERSPTPDSENALLVPRESLRPTAVKQKITPTRATTSNSTPLRIAPFAKEIISESPSALSPPVRTTELTTSNDGSMFSVSPAITMPSAATRGSIVRLPRDVTLQLRSNHGQQRDALYPSKVNYNPKHYAIRGEDRFGNMATTTQQSQQHQLQQEQPMTSHMAKLRANLLNKKRRLNVPTWESNDHNSQQPPAKVPRYQSQQPMLHNAGVRSSSSSYFPQKPRPTATAYNDEADDDDDDNNYQDYEDEQSSFANAPPLYRPPSFQRAYEQQYTTTASQKTKAPPQVAAPPQPPPQPANPKASKVRTPMEEVLKDMAMSLRQSQLQMVNDFFEQQMELARKEHEFQMAQDRLLMTAFKKQTQQLMKAARELFSSDAGGGSNGCGVSSSGSKNKPNERASNSHVSSRSKNAENYKNRNTRNVLDQTPSHQIEISSSDSDDNDDDEHEENGDSDPLLAAFDPTQFVSSELVDTNDENEEEES